MKNQITKRQNELLTIIYDFIRNSGYPPTLEEMRENLGVASNQSILDLLDKLAQQKLINKQEGIARSVTILPQAYKILNLPPLIETVGMATAGIPMEAVQLVGEWQTLPSLEGQEIKLLNAEVFLVQVTGDSMINAGINHGDAVLVQKHKEFYSGDIVLAEINNEVTIKRFMSEDKPPYVYLKPENPAYKNIRFTEDMQMQGKIIAVLKNGQIIAIK
jgi:repressor LexA